MILKECDKMILEEMEENEHNIWKTTLEKMNMEDQIKFLEIVLDNDIPYTENKNGTFINISDLKEAQLSTIKEFLEEAAVIEKGFNAYEEGKKELEKLICGDNQSDKKISSSNAECTSLNSY